MEQTGKFPEGRRFALIPIINMNKNRPNLKYEFLGRTEVWACKKETMLELHSKGLIVQTEHGAMPQKKQYFDEMEGVKVNTIWDDIYPVNSQAKQRTGYPTQKPEELLDRIIKTSSNEGSIIADFFCGSGTTLRAGEKNNRRWVGSDLSKTAIQVARSSLVQNEAKPFLIQNLGNYQRQLIYSKEIKLKEMYNIVLKLYGATPRTDWQGFGISKEDNKTLVFVCEPDRPMTGKKAVDLAKSAKTADGKGYKRLIILAWDFEYDFDDTFQRLTKNSKRDLADVEFKIIPSDVYKYLRSTKVGDQDLANKITFYEKPYLRLSEPQVSKRDKEEAQVKIKIEQYVLRDIPVKDESKRPEIEKMLHKNFANLIDYWTVDWDYDGEVFRSKWQAIRDRKSSDPVSTTADTTLKRGKKYTIAVRVVDVFGNDASLTKEIDLR
ncbi:site-specific DNA-methyltransferase [Candidatus Woesearchaeota archaeon]|nr:site-specific DNA-methyltransferase [Candidatus Woesearchaeota archaeon]